MRHPRPRSSCSRESYGQGKASAVVSAHGKRERGCSGRRENSDIPSLGGNRDSQVMSARKTSCRRGFLQDVWGRRGRGESLVIPRGNSV